GIERCRVRSRGAAISDLAFRDHFQAGNLRWVAMPFPTDQAGNAVPCLHAGAGKQPMLWPGTDPVGPAGHGERAARADERGLVRAVVLEQAQFGKAGLHGLFLNRPVLTAATDGAMRRAVG